jgi:hypothetical protein
MKVWKVSIRGSDFLIKKGIVRLVDYRDEITIEVELEMHPTIINFIDTLGITKEKVTIYIKNHLEITGKFDIHIGKSSVLMTSNLKDVEGADDLASIPNKKGSYLFHSNDGTSLHNELKTAQKTVLITILNSLLENEIKDEGNRVFINSLIEKLKKGEKLDSFDQFIKDEISYIMEEVMIEIK